MHSNEEIDRMREQILHLRYAGMLCARRIHNSPPYGKPGGDHLQWRAVGQLMQLVFESMNRSLLFTGIALDAVLEPDPKRWDRMCKEICRMKSVEYILSSYDGSYLLDQEDLVGSWGEMDEEEIRRIGTTFISAEWDVLTADRAWQNGLRLPQIIKILAGIDSAIAKHTDLFDSILCSGLLGDFNLDWWAAMEKDCKSLESRVPPPPTSSRRAGHKSGFTRKSRQLIGK